MVSALAFLVGLLLGVLLTSALVGFLAASSPPFVRYVNVLADTYGDDRAEGEGGYACDGDWTCPEPWASRASCRGCPFEVRS